MNLPSLTHLYVNPSASCNLACIHCWVSPERSGPPFRTRNRLEGEFTPDIFAELLDESAGLGLKYLKFTGGEPLLRSDFAELYSLAASHPSGAAIDLETNGTLVPEGLWRAFDISPPRLIAVSLDSSDPLLHDAFRNTRGAWKRSTGFVRNLIERGISTQVIMSVLACDAGPVLEMARFCAELGVCSLKINPVQPVGRGAGLRSPERDVREIIEFSREVHERCGHAVTVDVPPAFLPLGRLREAGVCPIHNLLGVLPDGGISFCGIGFTCPELVMGRFPEDDLETVWRLSPLLAKLREEVPAMIEGVCSRCIHLSGCLGKCVMENYCTGGSFTSPFWLCREAEKAGLFPGTRLVPACRA